MILVGKGRAREARPQFEEVKDQKVWRKRRCSLAQETMKFGRELPSTVEDALETDRKTGTGFLAECN
jgi:hypothetical protein